MPRSLWVIEVLQPKVRGEGMEWHPAEFFTKKAEAVRGLGDGSGGWMVDDRPAKARVRRWSPVEGR